MQHALIEMRCISFEEIILVFQRWLLQKKLIQRDNTF